MGQVLGTALETPHVHKQAFTCGGKRVEGADGEDRALRTFPQRPLLSSTWLCFWRAPAFHVGVPAVPYCGGYP